MYLWQRPGWPKFQWNRSGIADALAAARHRQGVLLGRMLALGFPLRQEASFRTLTEDVLKTSAIEGERLDPAQVRSSLARRLGMDVAGLVRADRNVEGVVEMMLDATGNFERKLTRRRLFDWHAALFPTGRSGIRRIVVGAWRDDRAGPMQVTSGPVGREKVHFVAPPAERVDGEMAAFLDWFNGQPAADPVLVSGIAHLWLLTIHPFEDGNGRIARAVADLALARSEASAQRFYSMSSRIQRERDAYYDVLEGTQKGALDITVWIEWYLGCFSRAIESAGETLGATLRKARFWERHAAAGFNERQRKVLNRLLDGLEGKLTSGKWAKLARCSQDTAYRDILDLVERGVLERNPGGGRSTSYSLVSGRFG
ncbi:MAG: cell filamentation protein Fic [Betaproteobacteria bacterium RIFCSPLOWO2_12_FULL_68_20]|nr:MAG: cell filamentation protein Fic [Betaproteobacteria bacterium RIFCSPLOWO2_12_FULL_68_20]